MYAMYCYTIRVIQAEFKNRIRKICKGAIWWQLLGGLKIFSNKEALKGLTNVIFPVCGEYWGLEPPFLKNFKLPSS